MKKKLKTIIVILSLFFLLLLITGCKTNKLQYENAITINELWKNKEDLLNKEIVVHGVIEKINTRCSGVVCTEKNPCCQGCAADLGFIISKNEHIIILDTGCSGN